MSFSGEYATLAAANPTTLAVVLEVTLNEATWDTGNGTLSAHVHGPAAKVILDFDVTLQEASYLNMSFGAFQGRLQR